MEIGLILNQIILILYSAYTIWSSQPGSSLFSWHPTCMTLSQFLALEGILLLRTSPLKWRLTIHLVVEGAAVILIISGFSVIYLNKEVNEKPHFTSLHSLAGVTTLVMMIAQVIGGTCAKLSVKTRYVTANQIRGVHRLCGTITLVLSSTTVFLIQRNWIDQLVYLISIVIPALYIFSGTKFIINLRRSLVS